MESVAFYEELIERLTRDLDQAKADLLIAQSLETATAVPVMEVQTAVIETTPEPVPVEDTQPIETFPFIDEET